MSNNIKVSVNLSAKKSGYVEILTKKFQSFIRLLVDPIALTCIYRYYRNSNAISNEKGWWEKENVTGTAFLTIHSVDANQTIGPYRLIVLNQEGTRDFFLDVWSIEKVIPQEEFIMFRYLNQQNKLSTLSLWCHDVKQRFEFINNIIKLLNERHGRTYPCDPYQSSSDVNSFVTSSSNKSPFPKTSASIKLLQAIRKDESTSKSTTDPFDLITDIQITKRSQISKLNQSDVVVTPEKTEKSSLLKKVLGVNSQIASQSTSTSLSPSLIAKSDPTTTLSSSPVTTQSVFLSAYSPQPTTPAVGSTATNYLLNKLNTPVGSQKR
mmetsp:Transcript_15940/g.14421  ORF Transcript_15940/g.14421 Transcript_15940/m.14421 type:complete len:322 (+) Transcript_15940:37-1002(+)